jgi:vacuolar-type H+-ATPase subunit H
LEEELALPEKDFERKLTERLREEIKMNKQKLDEEFRREFAEEKKRIVNQATREKEQLKAENKQLTNEIQRLKVLMRHGGSGAA